MLRGNPCDGLASHPGRGRERGEKEILLVASGYLEAGDKREPDGNLHYFLILMVIM